MPSLYLPELRQLQIGARFRLEGEEFHHLAHVAHRRASEPVRLNSGSGTLAWSRVLETGKHHALLEVTSVEAYPRFEHPFAIAFALLKNRHDELLVEKCTELGAEAFFPLLTEHSVRQASDNTAGRFRKTALAAIKQCDNPWLPQFSPAQTLTDALAQIKALGYTPILCSERHPERWLHHLSAEQTGRPCFLIGAEGGWSVGEFQQMEDLAEITLGNLTTRAETAAIAVSAQWLLHSQRF